MEKANKSPDIIRYMFWNVKNWGFTDIGKAEDERTARIIETVQNNDVDIASFVEVCHPEIMTKLKKLLPPGYTIHMTGGENTRKLITICKPSMDYDVSIIESDQFKSASGWSRHSPVITITRGDKKFAIQPIHTKSGSSEDCHQIRQDHLKFLYKRAGIFADKSIPLLITGDFNTMGNSAGISQEDEVSALGDDQGVVAVLPKTDTKTWKGIDEDACYPIANLDHAFITAQDISLLKSFDEAGNQVHVGGWPDYDTDEKQEEWIRKHSDHAYLMFDIKL